jgi:hypothetical protein
MEPTRRVVGGLTGAAFVLIAVGVVAVIYNAGFNGNGAAATGGAGTTMARPSFPVVSAPQTATPSAPHGSDTPDTPRPSLSASAVVSASASSHVAGFIGDGSELAYYAADGSVVPVPAVAGLEVQIQSGKANYTALASNPYGLGAGAYAGEFKPLVSMGQADGSSAEVGGLVLVGPVVTRLISGQLANMQAEADRWIVALPVDIRAATGPVVRISFDQFGLAGGSNAPRVEVGFPGSLPIVEAVPSNGGYHLLVEELGTSAWQIVDPTRLDLPSGSIDPAHAMNELVVYGSGTPTSNGLPIRRDVAYDAKVAVGQPLLSATIDVSVSLVVNGSHADLGPNRILTVGGVPVFVASS